LELRELQQVKASESTDISTSEVVSGLEANQSVSSEEHAAWSICHLARSELHQKKR